MNELTGPASDFRKGASYQNVGANGPGPKKVPPVAHKNVASKLAHRHTRTLVASGIARGETALHNDRSSTHKAAMLSLDDARGRFPKINADRPIPVALAATSRLAASELLLEAAE